MHKRIVGLIVVGAAETLALSACSSSSKSSSGSSSAGAGSSAASSAGSSSAASGKIDGKGAKVGIILPDTKSSARWQGADLPALQAQCKVDNLVCDIQNAQGSADTMKTIAQSMESNGVKVLMIVNLDNASGASIEKEATSKGITVVDYDRYTEGGTAALYVSFDGVAVGTAQGKALAACSQVAGKTAVNYVDVNGSPTDSNAAAFKKGYDGVLSVQAGWKKLDDQSIAGWDNPTAGTTFSGMLQSHPDINAVMVANDGMANAVIADLTNQKLNGKIAVSGQDATAQGLQHIMDGDQCFTIYKPSTAEAAPAVDAIAQLATGSIPTASGSVTDTNPAASGTNGGKTVPAILATPIAITLANVATPINDGYPGSTKTDVCTGAYVAKCTANGVK
jgi:D-xylose transport system substrate-binding protein